MGKVVMCGGSGSGVHGCDNAPKKNVYARLCVSVSVSVSVSVNEREIVCWDVLECVCAWWWCVCGVGVKVQG